VVRNLEAKNGGLSKSLFSYLAEAHSDSIVTLTPTSQSFKISIIPKIRWFSDATNHAGWKIYYQRVSELLL